MVPVPTNECGDLTARNYTVPECRRDVAQSSSRSEASNLLQSIGRQIKAPVSDYGVSISASPSTISFTSVRSSLGSMSVVAAFGRAMGRHEIIFVASSALATAGHRDSGKLTRG